VTTCSREQMKLFKTGDPRIQPKKSAHLSESRLDRREILSARGAQSERGLSEGRYAFEESSSKDIFSESLSFGRLIGGGSSGSSGDSQGRSPGRSRSISSGSPRPLLALSGGATLRLLSRIPGRSDEIRFGRDLRFVLPAEVAEVGLFRRPTAT